MKSIAIIIILMLSTQTHAEAFAPPDRDQILMTLKPDHPRLMMDANTLARIKEQIARDTVAAKTYQRHRNKRQRWEFYRIRAEGHNTLVFNPENGPDQNPKAECPITTFNATPNRATAILDLTDVYADNATRAQRTFEVIDQNHVIITDDIEAKSPSELWWFMHTRASVKPDGQTARLTRRGKHLKAEILSPSNAVFTVLDATPLPTSPNPKQADNTGRRKLAIHFTDVTKLKIKVKLTPIRD